jgi:putative oxidoreductase
MTASRPISFVTQYHSLFSKICCYGQSPFLLFVRLVMGWQFAIAGWGKLQNPGQIAGFFASLHLPFPAFTAVFVANVEFFGGILLILGLFSRVTGLVLTINMLVAYLTADWDAVSAWDFDKITKADPFAFLFASLIVLIYGAGVFSADWVLGRWLGGKTAAKA